MVRVWLLNFAGDEELSALHGKPAPIGKRFQQLVEKTGCLVAPGDYVLGETGLLPPGATIPADAEGRAWLPTLGARECFHTLKIPLRDGPTMDVLKRANSRKFSAQLGVGLPMAGFVSSLSELELALLRTPPHGYWLLTREHGFAGRGRLSVPAGPMLSATRQWAARSFDAGEGLEISPRMIRTFDLAIHGHLTRNGTASFGYPTRQVCDPRGQWLETRPLLHDELSEQEHAELLRSAQETATALTAIGYFGPFGIDAFRYRTFDGQALCSRCEINARYSMGWATGYAAAHPEARW